MGWQHAGFNAWGTPLSGEQADGCYSATGRQELQQATPAGILHFWRIFSFIVGCIFHLLPS
jgi:hypothetical protein